jgi:hypothetical protein
LKYVKEPFIFATQNKIDMWIDILQIGLPSLFLFLTTIFLVRGFLRNQNQSLNAFLIKEAEYRKVESNRRTIELTKANKNITMPLRMQAYERMTLFCTRLEITNMLRRSGALELTSKQLSIDLLFTVDEEYSHNIAQQLYMSEELWQIIQLAKLETVNILKNAQKTCDEKLGADAKANDYIDTLAAYLGENQQLGYIQALSAIKKEVSLLF